MTTDFHELKERFRGLLMPDPPKTGRRDDYVAALLFEDERVYFQDGPSDHIERAQLHASLRAFCAEAALATGIAKRGRSVDGACFDWMRRLCGDARPYTGYFAHRDQVTGQTVVRNTTNSFAVENVIKVSLKFLLELESEAKFTELSEVANPKPSSQTANIIAGGNCADISTAEQENRLAAPTSSMERKELVRCYLERETERTGIRSTRTIIWRNHLRHKDRQQFQRWQAGKVPSDNPLSISIMRVLRST